MDLNTPLGEVAWARLEHAYGDAADIPRLLLEISESKRIVAMLRSRLVHQGHVVYSATPEAVPILVDMVSDGGFPARPAIIQLLTMSG